jgi:DNA-binding transcriptional ArsR family regulator
MAGIKSQFGCNENARTGLSAGQISDNRGECVDGLTGRPKRMKCRGSVLAPQDILTAPFTSSYGYLTKNGNNMLHTIFGALADPTRFAIVEQLLEKGELTAGELAEPFEVSRPAISRHLKILEEAGVIERRVERQFRVFRARAEGFREIEDWFERHRLFWNVSFDRLQKLIEKGNPDDGRND